jgi:hypothetical protein
LLVGTTWGPTCVIGPAKVAGSKANVTVMVFRTGVGISLFIDGKAAAAAPAPQIAQLDALIGRGWEYNEMVPDSRYRGDVAEIAVYDIALPEVDRVALEGHWQKTWDTTTP